MEPVRLNKYLSEEGICSRRAADRLVDEGKILVNGLPATMGMKVTAEDEILVDGILVQHKENKKKVILAVNKPEGIVCTTAEFKNEKNIVDLVQYPERVYPIGRLDKDSSGLILMTNDGEMVNHILKSRNYHEKEYIVTVNKPLRDEVLEAMRTGVPLRELNTVTRPCKVTKTGPKEFNIVLTQGLNRQIRRMCEYFGYHVRTLKRIRIMNVELGNLPVGEYRELTAEEYTELQKG